MPTLQKKNLDMVGRISRLTGGIVGLGAAFGKAISRSASSQSTDPLEPASPRIDSTFQKMIHKTGSLLIPAPMASPQYGIWTYNIYFNLLGYFLTGFTVQRS
jgi:hypothetical protein